MRTQGFKLSRREGRAADGETFYEATAQTRPKHPQESAAPKTHCREEPPRNLHRLFASLYFVTHTPRTNKPDRCKYMNKHKPPTHRDLRTWAKHRHNHKLARRLLRGGPLENSVAASLGGAQNEQIAAAELLWFTQFRCDQVLRGSADAVHITRCL